jgi:very-short-patch-repair endonuclease
MTNDYSGYFKQSIYLAGKITAHGWRDDIVNPCWVEESSFDLRDDGTGIDFACIHPVPMPVAWRLRVGLHYDITGPFFVNCDHSCTHGQSTHATAGGCVGGHRGVMRDEVRRLCLDAIERSDVVFAWLDDATAYGTIAEIGRAHGAEKHIVLAVPPCPTKNVHGIVTEGGHSWEILCDCIIHGEQWFVAGMANHIIEAADATTAWNQWMGRHIEHRLETIKEYQELDLLLDQQEGQNEVELMFWIAHTNYGRARIHDLEPQYEISAGGKNYRLDFYSRSRKCAIEVDGLAYHNGQKSFIADRERQRILEMSGIRVLRFAAKEVMEDAEACYKQATKWAENV